MRAQPDRFPGAERVELVGAGASRRATGPDIMRLAFVLVLLGYGTKAGLAPMHTWKPDAYSEAPVPSAAILSSAHVELRPLRPDPLLHSDQPMPWRAVSWPTAASLRRALHGHLRAFHTGTEKLSPPAGLSHHRPCRHYGDGTGARGPAGQPGPHAAHDLSHHREVAAVPVRGQRVPALQAPTCSPKSRAE